MRRTIKIEALSRVEGEGGIYLRIKDRKVEDIRLNIFEPPRFFEAFLRDRHYTEVPDITARICGICPIAYQMSSVHAFEKIFGIKVEGQLRELRRLIYCAEWIASHALHVYFLNAPDFFGAESALQMETNFLKKALGLKARGNRLFSLIGGRAIHPVTVKAGGFYKTPSKKQLLEFLPELKHAYEDSIKDIRWACGLDFPDLTMDMEFVSLWHPSEYPMNEGLLRSSRGMTIDIGEFETHIRQEEVPHCTALPTKLDGRTYITGPIARVNLNYEKLSEDIKSALRCTELPIRNIFMGIIARTSEIAYALGEAIRIIENYEEPEAPSIEYEVKEGEAAWITEAPRGSLYHRYRIDKEGFVTNANIVPPTAQNIFQMEEALRVYAEKNINRSASALRKGCEAVVRSFDPCISCSVHMLGLNEF